ncbi:MAG: single-stranded-DNA-specific exonuclease RecJ [Anaerolineae bacterium]|nr:single-stranded-DNA-specific exonuclease RecJ [Anaerolineae bacterium]
MSLRPRYRWISRAREGAAATGSDGEDLLVRILRSRGLTSPAEVKAFLDPLGVGPLSPFDLPGAHEAVALLRWAIGRKRRIVVHGDYDADGLSATALMVKGLQSLGAQVVHYIPNRMDTGYGLDATTVAELASRADVLVTVDCGIRSVEEVSLARRLGMSVIVTDHHLPGPELPSADALVCPRLPGSRISEELSGVGVAYQVMRALGEVEQRFGDGRETGEQGTLWPFEDQVIELVALGTIADVAPLLGENRRLVRAGLERMRREPCVGIVELARVAGVPLAELSAWSVAFTIAPRINAAGRLGSSLPALELLLTASPGRAAELARFLDRTNRERQRQVKRCLEVAKKQEASWELDAAPLIFTAAEHYHPGIVGLVAGRLCDEYGVPAVAVCLDGRVAHGSVRCPEWFGASEALEGCSPWLDKHGGHSQAAGFTCAVAMLPRVERHLRDRAAAVGAGCDVRGTLAFDVELPLVGTGSALWQQLEALEPTGCGNPRPVLVSRGVRVLQKSLMGRDGNHLQMVLQQDGHQMRAVGFRLGHTLALLGDRVDLAYDLDEHSFNGTTERRLRVLDLADPFDSE